MGRAIAGVVVGYVAMIAVVLATLSAAYLGMGQDRAFEPGTHEPSGLWLVVSFALGLLAAGLGGFVCARISRGEKAPPVLAGSCWCWVCCPRSRCDGPRGGRGADRRGQQPGRHAEGPAAALGGAAEPVRRGGGRPDRRSAAARQVAQPDTEEDGASHR
jgi:hypothetical protein